MQDLLLPRSLKDISPRMFEEVWHHVQLTLYRGSPYQYAGES